jgi:hypothetical protein
MAFATPCDKVSSLPRTRKNFVANKVGETLCKVRISEMTCLEHDWLGA